MMKEGRGEDLLSFFIEISLQILIKFLILRYAMHERIFFAYHLLILFVSTNNQNY